MHITDDQLRWAAASAADKLAAELPDETEIQWDSSSAFDGKMQKLVRKVRRRQQQKLLLKAACISLVLLSGAVTLCLGTDQTAYAAVKSWFAEQYDLMQTHYFSRTDGELSLEDVHFELTYIPEDYVYLYTTTSQTSAISYYENNQGQRLTFGYILENDDSHLFLYAPSSAKETIAVHDKNADYYPPPSEDQGATLIWTDSVTNCLLYIDGYFSKHELVKIAESIESNLVISTN